MVDFISCRACSFYFCDDPLGLPKRLESWAWGVLILLEALLLLCCCILSEMVLQYKDAIWHLRLESAIVSCVMSNETDLHPSVLMYLLTLHILVSVIDFTENVLD